MTAHRACIALSAALLTALLAGPPAAGQAVPAGKSAAPGIDHKGATAHEPHFEDKQVWPKLTGKEYFVAQRWGKGKLMVWAHPGTNGGKRAKGLNPFDPNSWIEDGQPCRKVAFDKNTDILLPASDKPYQLNFREDPWPEVYRHITVERGATFGGGGDGRGRQIHGNVWIKQGAGMDAQGATRFMGDGHTFFRNDNTAKTARHMGRGGGIMSSQYFTFNKTQGKSVEFLGHVSVLDEFRIYGCLAIVGADSLLQPGRNAAPSISQGGALVLLDGARWESWNNDFGTPELTVGDGVIQGGLPERPLTRSCTIGLAFKNYTKAEHADLDDKARSRRFVRSPGLVVVKGAIRCYTVDPAKARLVFTEMENQDICPRPGTEAYERDVKRWPEHKALYAWMAQLPRGLDCYIGKDVTVDGVEFDHIRKGGLLLDAPGAQARWKNVFYGPNCQAKGEALFTVVGPLDRHGHY